MDVEDPRADDASEREDKVSVKAEMQKLELAKITIEAAIKRLQKEMDSKEANLKMCYLLKSDYFQAVHNRRVRARKVVAASLAVLLASLTAGIRCSTDAAFSEALPWTVGIGVTSLAFSLIFSKDVWRIFKEHALCKILETPDMVKTKPEYSYEDIDCKKILFQTSMPELCLFFKICSAGKKIGARRMQRVVTL